MNTKNTPAAATMTANAQDSIPLKLSNDDAQAICAQYGYVPTYELLPGVIEDWGGSLHGYPLFYYPVRCNLHHYETGQHAGQGNGSCSNWEKKYRYRGGERTCPQCGKAALIKGKLEYERDAAYKQRGSWICFERRGGCGAKYYGDDATITGQDTGRVDNPDFADLVHVVRRMADKRALVAAVQSTPGFAARLVRQPAAPPAVRPAAPPPPAPEPVDDWKSQQPTLGSLKAEADMKASALGQAAGTKAAADAVAAQKLANLRKGPSSFPKFETPELKVSNRLPANMERIKAAFDSLRPHLTAAEIVAAFTRIGGADCRNLTDLESLADMQAVYDLLMEAADKRRAKKGVAA